MHFTYTAKCTPSSVSVIVVDHERNIEKTTDLLALPPPFKAAKIPECVKCPNEDNRMFGDQSAAETMYKNTSLRDSDLKHCGRFMTQGSSTITTYRTKGLTGDSF